MFICECWNSPERDRTWRYWYNRLECQRSPAVQISEPQCHIHLMEDKRLSLEIQLPHPQVKNCAFDLIYWGVLCLEVWSFVRQIFTGDIVVSIGNHTNFTWGILHWVQLAMQIYCIDRPTAAWFKSDLCVRCASYNATQLTKDDGPFFCLQNLAELLLMWQQNVCRKLDFYSQIKYRCYHYSMMGLSIC